MKRWRDVLIGALGMVSAGACEQPAADPASQAVEPAAPTFADVWYITSAAEGLLPTALNIHETAVGLAGRVLLPDGAVLPVRNIVQDAQSLAFIVPGMDMVFTATKSPEGFWSGEAVEGDKSTALVFSPGPAPDVGARRFVGLPDGRQMNLVCAGSGTPTVVFDSGAGATTASWTSVQAEIAKTTRTCAYDRAGLGLSDPGALPRDVAAVASDLDALLKAAGEAGPNVLVGHSLGSFHVRYYANIHPDQVAGMVLVDPSGDGQAERFTKVIPAFRQVLMKTWENQASFNCVARMREGLVRRDDPIAEPCGGNDPDTIEQGLAEIEAMDGASTEQLLATRKSYGDLPLIVLTRADYEKGMPPELTAQDREAMAKVWIDMHEEMAALSTAGERRVVAGAGHNIQHDKPQAVIDAVNEVVAKARSQTGAR